MSDIEPSALPDTLYHYCSNQTFHSIIAGGPTVRLSAMSLSNDSMEGRLVSSLILDQARIQALPQVQIEDIKSALQFWEEKTEGLGFCLSSNGDLLSQWRGYANDGKGVSIGFSVKYLEQLSNSSSNDLSLKEVIYSQERQVQLIADTYDTLKKTVSDRPPLQPFSLLTVPETKDEREEKIKEWQRKKVNFNIGVIHALASQLENLYRLKSGAFSEEQEWRLLNFTFKESAGVLCRPTDDCLIPYKEYQLELESELSPITSVILGPKNRTPIPVVRTFLESVGLKGVKVSKSVASYR